MMLNGYVPTITTGVHILQQTISRENLQESHTAKFSQVPFFVVCIAHKIIYVSH